MIGASANHWTLFTQLNKDGDCRSLHGRVLDARDSFVSASSAASIWRFGWPDHGPAPVVGDSADTFPDADSKLRPSGSISIRYDYTVTTESSLPDGRSEWDRRSRGTTGALRVPEGGQAGRCRAPDAYEKWWATPWCVRVASGAPCVEYAVPVPPYVGWRGTQRTTGTLSGLQSVWSSSGQLVAGRSGSGHG